MVKCLRIEKEYAAIHIDRLRDINGIDQSYEIDRDERFVYVPLSKVLSACRGDYDIVERNCKKKEERPTTLKEYLLSKGYKTYVRAFDIIGEVAVVEIPEGIAEKDVAEGIMSIYKGIKAVYSKASGREGDFRLYDLKLIGGTEVDVTEHHENGIRMLVNVRKVFFSPRAASERKYVSNYISALSGKKVMVFFAGIGPYCLVGAKENPDKQFIGIELNPDAFELFQKNILLNNLGNVTAVLGDVKEKARDFAGQNFDYVVMPLPKIASTFLEEAVSVLKDKGYVILYCFAPVNDYQRQIVKYIHDNLHSPKKVEFVELKEIDSYSPTESKYRVILRITK